ncbi:hypothetical protein [Streptomyces sp. NPDC045714]|uniref:hypothetical protein n=1 Tax=Streptomyces sp. NPDC045714 TaxID=3154913 RepID=UPI0034067FAB
MNEAGIQRLAGLLGLALGALAGALLDGGTGAVIGAFVGCFAAADLLGGLLLLMEVPSLRSRTAPGSMDREALALGARGAWGLVLTGAGACGGALLGHRLGPTDFAQAAGVFVGMALGCSLATVVAKTFTVVKIVDGIMVSLSRLLVGAVVWALHTVWTGPLSALVGIVLGLIAVALIGALFFAYRPGY